METSQNYPSATESHLFEDEILQFEDASNGQRFINFLIDSLLIRFGLDYFTGYAIIELLSATNPELVYSWFGTDASPFTLFIIGYGIAIINFTFYYTLCEKAFKGYSLGKLISGTRAIRNDGAELTFKDAFLRSLSRLVPFEALSIWFGNGLWHDTWTKTRVIKSR